MRRPTALFACLALAAGTVAGCGEDSEDTASTPAEPAATQPAETQPEASDAASGEEVKVGIKDIKFVPESITVKADQKVVWTNNESVPHNVTAKEGADFTSDNLNEGDTFDYTPTKAGTIAYVCTIHPGQNGSITVTE